MIFRIGFTILICMHCFSVLADSRDRWTEGHGDLILAYSGDWDWQIGHDHSPDELLIVLDQNAQNLIPDNPDFAFLGNSDSPIWIIPQTHREEVVYMGLDSTGIPQGIFENDQIQLKLASVSGPGDLIVWITDETGGVNVSMNSRDGIDSQDTMTLPALGHFHQNFGFTSPGTYQIGFTASGILSETSETITSKEMIYHFAVGVFEEGEIELELEYEENDLTLILLDEANERELETTDLAISVAPLAWQRISSDSAFRFLGEAEKGIFILPQDEQEGLPFLGMAGDEIDSGLFEGDQVMLELISIEGAGDLFLYSVDAFGMPRTFFNSSDGLDETDRFPILAGSHSHLNWAFTASGIYQIGLKASGILADGTSIASEIHPLLFEVVAPTILHEGELDLEVIFEKEKQMWKLLGIHEGREFCPSQLLMRGANRDMVPTDLRLSFLGEMGETIHVFPQNEKDGALSIGIAGDAIPENQFEGNQVMLKMIDVKGQGEGLLYAIDSLGSPSVFFNSTNGIDEEDRFPIKVGSHSHLNWAFTASGIHKVALQISGVLSENKESIVSDVFELTFDISHSQNQLHLLRKNGALGLSWFSVVGTSYQVQSSIHLNEKWMNEGEAIEGTGEAIELPLSSSSDHRFYRIIASPSSK